MGRIWTVSGMARAALCAQALFTLSACSNANLGWNYFPGYGRLHGYFPPLRVSGPNFVSAAAGCSPAFSVGFDSGNGFVSSTADVKLQLGGSGSPKFYSDPGCMNLITETTLATGATVQSFYLKNPTAGVQQIQTSHPDLPSASRTYQVDPAPPVAIKLVKGPTSFAANACVELEVGFVDADGNQVPFDQGDMLTFTLIGLGGETIHDQSDPFCSGPATMSYGLFPGAWTQIIHLTSSTSSDTMTLGASTTLLTMPSVTLTTGPAPAVATQVMITGVQDQLQTGNCDQLTAFPADAAGNPLTAAAPTLITFASPSGNVSFYTDLNCTLPGNTSTASPGGAAQIFVKDTAKEKARITADAAGYTGAFIDITFANLALQVVAGDEHTCALLRDGSVECWGSNVHGQLGVVATMGLTAVPLASAVFVPLPGKVSSLASGPNHTCAIVQAGASDRIWCWGRNSHGELGPGGTIGVDSAIPLQAFAPGNFIVDVAAGAAHSCAVEGGGALWCWGNNTDGQLADVGSFGGDRPAPFNILGFVTGWVLTSGDTTCSLDFSDGLRCWGSNAWGQLQADPVGTPNSAIPILLSASSRSAGLGSNQACLMDATTLDLSCWGRNLYGELGTIMGFGGTTPVYTPVSPGVQRQAPPAAIMGGDGFTCAVLYSGLLCFGRNDYGQLGNGSTVTTYEPTLLPIYVNNNYKPGFGAGKSHACAAQGDGKVVCWGLNDHAQIGLSPTATPFSVTPVFLSP